MTRVFIANDVTLFIQEKYLWGKKGEGYMFADAFVGIEVNYQSENKIFTALDERQLS